MNLLQFLYCVLFFPQLPRTQTPKHFSAHPERLQSGRSRALRTSLPTTGPRAVSPFLLLAVSRSISGGRRRSNFSTGRILRSPMSERLHLEPQPITRVSSCCTSHDGLIMQKHKFKVAPHLKRK